MVRQLVLLLIWRFITRNHTTSGFRSTLPARIGLDREWREAFVTRMSVKYHSRLREFRQQLGCRRRKAEQ